MQCMIREQRIVKIIKGNVVRLLLQHSVSVFGEEMIMCEEPPTTARLNEPN